MRANGYIVDFDHPVHGPTPMVGIPVRLSETPGSVRTPAPEHGQHSEEILIDLLGYDWERITALREKKAI
jgi:crotonobetainyl-CoA:carnitine CoA-transferase CaiB-like acyl-CoA transferase